MINRIFLEKVFNMTRIVSYYLWYSDLIKQRKRGLRKWS